LAFGTQQLFDKALQVTALTTVTVQIH